MRLLRGVAGRVMTCGCLLGVYETYQGGIIGSIDALGPTCDHPRHRLHELVPIERDGPPLVTAISQRDGKHPDQGLLESSLDFPGGIMFRKPVTVVISLLAMLLAAGRLASAQSPTPSIDDLVTKNLQAKGGLDKLKAVQTMKMSGRITIQGMDGTLTLYMRRPNLVRQEMVIAGRTIVNAFDGTTVWLVNPLTGSSDPTVITGPVADATRDQSDFDSPLNDYKDKGYRIELVGLETLNGKSVQHLKLTGRRQQVQHCYLDNDSGLELRVVSETPAGELQQELSDYREVDGVKLPFSIRTLSNGVPMAQLAFEKVDLNPTLDDALFKMPVRNKSAVR